MKTNNQLVLKKTFYRITAVLILGLVSVAANGDTGIANTRLSSSSDPSASLGQSAAYNALDQLCNSFGSNSSLACSLTDSGGANNSTTLQNLSPQSAMQAETISITSPKKFVQSINNKGQKLMECNSYQTKEDKLECIKEGAGSTDAYDFIGPVGISISGGGGIGDRETVGGQTGFQLDTRQTNLMIDYSFNRQLVGGFSFGYLGTERNMALNSGSLDSDSFRFAPFLLFRPTANSYLSLTGGYALISYDSTRKVSEFEGITINDSTANYDADQYFVSLGAGYSFAFMDGWSLRGYGRGDYIHTDIGGFQESGGMGSDNRFYSLNVDSQSIDSLTSTIGAELSYKISTSILYPAVIIPKFRAEWVHEFKNSGDAINAEFNQNPGVSSGTGTLGIGIAGPERNWANLGFGLQMLFPRAIVGYINYDALLIDNASNHIISGGVRINF